MHMTVRNVAEGEDGELVFASLLAYLTLQSIPEVILRRSCHLVWRLWAPVLSPSPSLVCLVC